jgi:hypothetical protein
MISDVHRFHQHKRLRETLAENERRHFPMRKIKEDPLFQPKRQSHPLIVADFCCYVWKKFLENDRRYNRFFNRFRKQIIYFEDFAMAARAS